MGYSLMVVVGLVGLGYPLRTMKRENYENVLGLKFIRGILRWWKVEEVWQP
jgi:hypothetical protein